MGKSTCMSPQAWVSSSHRGKSRETPMLGVLRALVDHPWVQGGHSALPGQADSTLGAGWDHHILQAAGVGVCRTLCSRGSSGLRTCPYLSPTSGEPEQGSDSPHCLFCPHSFHGAPAQG